MLSLRTVVVGAGLMGRWHADAIRRAEGTVVAVVDRHLASAQRLAVRCPGAVATTSLERFIEHEAVDVVHLCTPVATHAELAREALEQRVHVLAEKPLTATAGETRALFDLAARQGVLLCPVHQFPFQAGVQRLRAAPHRLGELSHLEARFCSAGARGLDHEGQEAVVADVLPHPLSLLRVFAAPLLDDAAWTTTRAAAGELVAVAASGGTTTSIMVSMSSRPTSATLTLRGDLGTAHLDLFHGFCVLEPGAVSRRRKIAHPFDLSARTVLAAGVNLVRRTQRAEAAYPGLRTLVGAFHTAVRNATASPIPRDDAVAVATARDAILDLDRQMVARHATDS